MQGDSENLELEAPKHNVNLWAMSLADLLSIMLTFFVLLFSYSSTSRIKSQRAMEGVQGTFSQETRQSENVPEQPVLDTERPLKGYYADIKKVARDILEIDEAAIVEKGNVMIMRLPVKLMFSPGTAEMEDKKIFLEKLADQLTTTVLSENIDIEFMTGYQAGMKEGEASAPLAVARAGAFARKMVELGVKERMIYVGVGETDPAFFTITFFPRDEERAKQIF